MYHEYKFWKTRSFDYVIVYNYETSRTMYIHTDQYMYICQQVMNSHSQSDDKLGDYCDGEQYKTSALFIEDPCALQIQLFYDEVEVCNPIGSKAKKHKLGKISNYTVAYNRVCITQGLCTILLEIYTLDYDHH